MSYTHTLVLKDPSQLSINLKDPSKLSINLEDQGLGEMISLRMSLGSTTLINRGLSDFPWILDTGLWNDLGVWFDNENWNDGV